MSEHISLERLFAFAFAGMNGEAFDQSAFNKEADVINAHLLECDECYEVYSILNRLSDSIEELNSLESKAVIEAEFEKMVAERNKVFDAECKKARIKDKILLSIEKITDVPDYIRDEIELFKGFIKEKADGITVKIDDFTKIMCNGIGSGMQFNYYRPAHALVAKSVDGEVIDKEFVTNVMVDGKNMVSVDEGTNSIKLLLDANRIQGRIICLVPENAEEAITKILDDDCFDEDNETIEVVFENVTPGAYDVVWQGE